MTLVDLFAGCGGMTRGFEDSGAFRSVFAVEFDRDAAATYAANFGDHVACGRIEDVAAFPSADVVIGGPPCQGFSPLNREAVGFERRGLWTEYLRALEAAEPQAFVMENVPELLRSAEYAEFQKRAEALGFSVDGEILNAADFGVPQRRRRAIVIGTRTSAAPSLEGHRKVRRQYVGGLRSLRLPCYVRNDPRLSLIPEQLPQLAGYYRWAKRRSAAAVPDSGKTFISKT